LNRVFVDTSAMLALLDSGDLHHERARAAFNGLAGEEALLLTTSFVLVETHALVSRRLGLDAVVDLREHFAPTLDVVWVDRGLYEPGLDLLLERKRRRLSLVDAVSFVCMRRERIDRAFAFDRHFSDEGFRVVS